MLMHRQAPIAIGALAACAVIASGSVLLREQILSFSSWPDAGGGGHTPEIAIPDVRPVLMPGSAALSSAAQITPRVRTSAARAALLGLGAGGGSFALPAPGSATAGGDGG